MDNFLSLISEMRLMAEDLGSPDHSVIYAHHISQTNFITLESSWILDLALETISHM